MDLPRTADANGKSGARRRSVGVITEGSLTEGVEMKLNPDQSVEDVKAGKFVVVDGFKNEFFSMITDLRLDATNPDIRHNSSAAPDTARSAGRSPRRRCRDR